MKRALTYTLLSALVIIGAAGPRTIGAEDGQGWPELPELRFQSCISATQSIKHNPFSTINNDFILVTTYEEDENGDSNRREAPVTTAALNVYLVMGAFMAEDKPEGQVHGMALIVEKRNNNVSQRSEPSLKRWVLLDENGDGRLDKALFRKNPHHKRDTAAKGQEALAVPSEKLPDLQAYFDKAVRDLSKKALNGSGEACLFV